VGLGCVGGSPVFVGRDRELARLRAVVGGGEARLLLVVGDAGVGKTGHRQPARRHHRDLRDRAAHRNPRRGHPHPTAAAHRPAARRLPSDTTRPSDTPGPLLPVEDRLTRRRPASSPRSTPTCSQWTACATAPAARHHDYRVQTTKCWNASATSRSCSGRNGRSGSPRALAAPTPTRSGLPYRSACSYPADSRRTSRRPPPSCAHSGPDTPA
jgi:hypothetical protein